MKIELELTREQARLLLDTLESTTDEGPAGEGWKSNELSSLCGIVSEAVHKAVSHYSVE